MSEQPTDEDAPSLIGETRLTIKEVYIVSVKKTVWGVYMRHF